MKATRTSVLFDIYIAGQLASELLTRQLERLRLKTSAHVLLAHLARRGPLTPGDLEKETGLRPSTLRERMQPLFDGELVRRIPSGEDRRSHRIEVTDRGREMLDGAWPAIEAAERALQDQLGQELESYRATLAELVRAGQEAAAGDHG